MAVARGLSFSLDVSFHGFLVFLYSIVTVSIVSVSRKQVDMALLYLKQSQRPSRAQRERT